jgi:hypothetical protein
MIGYKLGIKIKTPSSPFIFTDSKFLPEVREPEIEKL